MLRSLRLKRILCLRLLGHLLLVLLDWYIVIGKKGPYQGHFGIITGFDSKNIYFHNSGPKNPKPNMKIPKDVIYKSMGFGRSR